LKIEKVEVIGFRGLVNEEFTVDDLSVFEGEMGSGKTSKLLAILFSLTGQSPAGITLDDLINTNSEYMLVKVDGKIDGTSFFLERRKKRGSSVSVKTNLQELPTIKEKIFIEGREIARLFSGRPTEKTVKIDTLLGLSTYNQITNEIIISPIEKKIQEIEKKIANTDRISDINKKLNEVENKINSNKELLSNNQAQQKKDFELIPWAQEIQKKVDSNREAQFELDEKKKSIAEYKSQLELYPMENQEIIDEVKEIDSRNEALNKRIAALESSMQIMDLQGKKIDQIRTCPLCGAYISSKTLEQFKHLDEEYKQHITWSSDLQHLLHSKRKKLEAFLKKTEHRKFLEEEIKRLESLIEEINRYSIPSEDAMKATSILENVEKLENDEKTLDLIEKNLEEQKEAYSVALSQSESVDTDKLLKSLSSLNKFAESLSNIKHNLIATLNEVRTKKIQTLKYSFKESFKKIYPYERISEVDFQTNQIRGKEVLQVKGKVKNFWLYSHQMSTGENVAISFALLFAINKLEYTPLLLLDEPEEGLDTKGIIGFADLLKKMKMNTQLMVATRSPFLASQLKNLNNNFKDV